MKKVLKVLACSLVISMFFSCAAFAKPVHTNLLSDSDKAGNSAMDFVNVINKGFTLFNMGMPNMTNFNLIDDGSASTNAYLGSWGSSTVIIKEDAATKKVRYISISLPSSFKTEDGTFEESCFFRSCGFVSGFINSSNDDISKADTHAVDEKLKACFDSKSTCSCSAGKLHYEWVYNDNILMMSISAIVDDGTK